MITDDKANGEARCFLCTKDKLGSFNFYEEDFLSLLLNKKSINEKDLPTTKIKKTSAFNLIKFENQNLIKPCKCGTFVHLPCLIQHCILHLGYRCEECQSDYNFNFKPLTQSNISYCSVYTQIIFTIIFHLVLLAITILFFSVEIIPNKYNFWNYLIGIFVLFFNISIAFCNIILFKGKLKHIQRIYPLFEPYIESKKKTKEEYDNMKIFFEQVLQSDIYELMEKKVNNKFYISSSLNPQRDINDYIVANNNEIFDSNSERVKEELKNEDLEDKFHGHQIIKSTLVLNDLQHNNLFGKKGTKTNYFDLGESESKVNFYKSQTRNQNMRKEPKIPKGNGVNSMVKIQFNTNNNITKKEGELNSKGNLLGDSVTMKVDKKNNNENVTNTKEEIKDEDKPTIEQLMMKNMKKIKKKVEEIKNNNDIPIANSQSK